MTKIKATDHHQERERRQVVMWNAIIVAERVTLPETAKAEEDPDHHVEETAEIAGIEEEAIEMIEEIEEADQTPGVEDETEMIEEIEGEGLDLMKTAIAKEMTLEVTTKTEEIEETNTMIEEEREEIQEIVRMTITVDPTHHAAGKIETKTEDAVEATDLQAIEAAEMPVMIEPTLMKDRLITTVITPEAMNLTSSVDQTFRKTVTVNNAKSK